MFIPFRNPFEDTVSKMDFSQIEAQCAAHMVASEEPMVKRDIYTELASGKFGVPEENITPAMRKAAKEYFFSFMYGGL